MALAGSRLSEFQNYSWELLPWTVRVEVCWGALPFVCSLTFNPYFAVEVVKCQLAACDREQHFHCSNHFKVLDVIVMSTSWVFVLCRMGMARVLEHFQYLLSDFEVLGKKDLLACNEHECADGERIGIRCGI
eukprot:jgi/Botrbrau1/10210/Bobra.116_1s0026.1